MSEDGGSTDVDEDGDVRGLVEDLYGMTESSSAAYSKIDALSSLVIKERQHSRELEKEIARLKEENERLKQEKKMRIWDQIISEGNGNALKKTIEKMTEIYAKITIVDSEYTAITKQLSQYKYNHHCFDMEEYSVLWYQRLMIVGKMQDFLDPIESLDSDMTDQMGLVMDELHECKKDMNERIDSLIQEYINSYTECVNDSSEWRERIESLPEYLSDWERKSIVHYRWQIILIQRFMFRQYFSDTSMIVLIMQQCGHFIDNHMSQIIHEYAYSLRYRKGDSTVTIYDDSVMYDAIITEDGTSMFTCGKSKMIALWDLINFNIIAKWDAHNDYICCLVLNHRKKILVSGSKDTMIKLWKISNSVSGGGSNNDSFSFELIHCLKGHNGLVRSVDIDDDGQKIISCSLDMTLRLWSVDNGECLKKYSYGDGHSDPPRCVKFIINVADSMSLNCNFLSGSEDKSLKYWDTHDERSLILRSSVEGLSGQVWSIDINCDQTIIACGCLYKCITLLSWPELEIIGTIPGGNIAVRFHGSDPDLFAIGMTDFSVCVFNVKMNQLSLKFKGHSHHIWQVCWTPDCSRIVSVAEDHQIRMWDVSVLFGYDF